MALESLLKRFLVDVRSRLRGSQLHALAPLVDGLHGWDALSPFSWYAGDEVLLQGATVVHVVAPVALAVVLCGAAAVVLDCRDLAAG